MPANSRKVLRPFLQIRRNHVLLPKVKAFCKKNSLLVSHDKIVIGVSGGPDSLALLHLLLALSPKFDLTLTVAHLNHQLRGPDSDADAAYVQEIAARWQLPVILEAHNVANLAARRKQSLEEAARQVRYAFLWRVAIDQGANKIAVGHNSGDQVETILMHFLRGTGLAGLRGMLPQIDVATLSLYSEDIPDSASVPAPRLIRPLLETSRTDIEAYCRENELAPRQDFSNLDTTFYRNRLRHKLIPELETYNPNIRRILQRTAKVIAAEIEILNERLDEVWPLVVKHESAGRIEFELAQWLDLPLALKRSILRRAVHLLRRSLRDIGFEHIENAIDIVEKGSTGAKTTLPQGLMLIRSYQTLVVAPEETLLARHDFDGPYLDSDQVIKLNLSGATPIPGSDWQIEARYLSFQNLDENQVKQTDRWEAYLDADIVGDEAILRPRQPGDTFCPLGMAGHHKKINDFMINEKIPADWRDYIPLLVSDNRILWVCGYRPDEQARLKSDTRWVLHLKFKLQ